MHAQDSIIGDDNLGESWGVCVEKPRLPGAGLNYSKEELYSFLQISKTAIPASCASVAMEFVGNKATRYVKLKNSDDRNEPILLNI